MAQLVSDEVWAQLDPDTGRLSRPTVRWMTVALSAAALVLASGALLWRSGVVMAHLSWDRYAGGYSHSGGPSGRVEQNVKVHNDGWTAVTLLGAGRDMPGMSLVEVSPVFPFALGPGETMEFVVTFEVVECAEVSRDAWPVPVTVRRWWGEQTAYIELPKEIRRAPHGVIIDPGPYEVEWQYELGALACGF